jgi:hypothetical protein
VSLAFRTCARPWPIFGPFHQPRGNRIIFDVPANPPVLDGIPRPMIVRFALPKMFLAPAKNPIALARARAFDAIHYPAYRRRRSDQHVHMVCHDDVRVQLIVTQDYRSADQGLNHTLSHSRIA